MEYLLPDLPFAYDALEPYIDAKTMRVHHDAHHKTYVEKLNEALADCPQWQLPVEQLLARLDEIPEDLREAVRNNGGGHHNHTLFWTMLTPGASKKAKGDLLRAIDGTFGGMSAFKEKFSALAADHFSNGWAWLLADGERLVLETTHDHESPLTKGLQPLLVLDLWEHAYYLLHQNERPAYIDAFWSVVNWHEVGLRFDEIRSKGQTTREWRIAGKRLAA